ncbi:hypothetical protein ZeamMp080 (mitochondrion) [Zea mays subsp. mays]|jgi:hypothetical protein|uniref:Uncharacterized protein orf130 n=1 Tax=Zea mays TaxID=4577 RepID=Q6R9G6_MAIZE|nr:hypothetical protein ZeamMp080 [Zea mays subsp. mays]AAR91106.1 hypothetical protein [Zea mays]WEB51463.1 hypothetical protein [Zea mays]WEB51625.1 hypothetical protein [Zea mays]|eukprot:YP_588342.1 hypothetical protein ZeamMp080 (mitochondrion) [Zea mays subsp. mays]
MAKSILFQDMDSAGNAIRNPQTNCEYNPKMFQRILLDLQLEGIQSKYYSQFVNQRVDSIPKESWNNLRIDELPLNQFNQEKFLLLGCFVSWFHWRNYPRRAMRGEAGGSRLNPSKSLEGKFIPLVCACII